MVDSKKYFSDKFFISFDEKLLDFPDVQKFIFLGDKIEPVIRIGKTSGHKILQINFTGRLEDALRIDKHENQIIKIFPNSEKEIIRQAKTLKQKSFIFCPAYPIEKVEHISLLSSMGFVVDLIHAIDILDTPLTIEILDFYLHNRSLKVPIEPFHTILLSKIRQFKNTLWNMNLMNPSLFFYSDSMGLAESPEALERKEYHFLIDNQNKIFVRTNRKSEMEIFYRSLPREHAECMSCPHFHICFSWAIYQKNSCEKWKKILTLLQEASREIQALEKFDQEHAIDKNQKT